MSEIGARAGRRSIARALALTVVAAATVVGAADAAGEPTRTTTTTVAATVAIAPTAIDGSVARSGVAGTWVLTTDGADAAYSLGRARLATVTGRYRLALRWRRLDADVSSLELFLPTGVVVLLRDGELAMWIDDASFERDGWHPLAGYRTQVAADVVVEQRAAEVVVVVDGREVLRRAAPASAQPGPLTVGLKGAVRRRARARLAAMTLTTDDGPAPRGRPGD